nr:hypothetical protein [Tanacetum cinerariifolium]
MEAQDHQDPLKGQDRLHHEIIRSVKPPQFRSVDIEISLDWFQQQLEELEFDVTNLNLPQDQEENPSNDDEKTKGKVAYVRDWFTIPKQPQEATDPDWTGRKTAQQGPTQSWYLKEIVVRRADNDLYKFKEGDFLRLRINDIEDMLLLVVQNRLTNLSGDDVSDFAITLRMFTRSIVIQKNINTTAGNPVKEILLKLNLPDHRLILMDSKMDMKVPGSGRLTRFIATCLYSTDIYKDIMKAQVHVSRLLLL